MSLKENWFLVGFFVCGLGGVLRFEFEGVKWDELGLRFVFWDRGVGCFLVSLFDGFF